MRTSWVVRFDRTAPPGSTGDRPAPYQLPAIGLPRLLNPDQLLVPLGM
jgi:hypothetical protein